MDTIWELQWENCWFEWNVFWLDLSHWWFNCQKFLPDLISQKTHSTFAHPLVLLESLCWCEIKISLKTKIVLPQFWTSSNLENISHSFLTSMAGCNASFAGNSATQALWSHLILIRHPVKGETNSVIFIWSHILRNVQQVLSLTLSSFFKNLMECFLF